MVNDTENPGCGKIYEAICAVMDDIGAVGKNDLNKQQGFKYRGIDAVMNALSPAMNRHKVFCTPKVLEHTREERVTAKGNTLIYSICKISYQFYTTDGSYVEAITIGEGMDSGDKATNKAMAIAFKYACFQTFCIPTEELMDDPDKESPEAGKRKRPATKTQQDSGKGQPQSGGKASGNPEEAGRQVEQVGVQPGKVNADMVRSIQSELERTGKAEKTILAAYGIKQIEEMTVKQYENCMKRFEMTPDKGEKGRTA